MSSSRAFGRFIPSEEVGAAVSWNFGAVDPAAAARMLAWQEREETAAQREAAYAQGFDAGLAAAGELSARQVEQFMRDTGRQMAGHLSDAVAGLTGELDSARQDMAAQLLDLACEVARQVVRSELAGRPDAIRPVIDEALGMIIDDNVPRTLRLHPDDLALVGEEFPATAVGAQVVLRADPSLARGGCVVEAGGALIDATVEKRWMRAVANLGLQDHWKDAADAGI